MTAAIATTARSSARLLIRVLSVVLVAIVLAAVAVVVVIPAATQSKALSVLSGSMTPEIPVGSIVLVRPVDPATLQVGDVATYQTRPGVAQFITHRITAIHTDTTPTTFTFKGDANRGPDINPVPATAIRGEVWFHVPYLGTVRDLMQTRGGILGAAMLLLGGYAVYQLGSALNDRRQGRITATPKHSRHAGAHGA